MEISSRDGTLQPKQINAIIGFSRSAVSSRSSKITILRPSGGGASGKVAREIYQLMVRSDITPSMIVQKTYPGPSKGPVQLSFVRSVAVTKECGDWSTDLTSTSRNGPYPNLGCSIQNNIAALVANPDDLVVPEPTAPALAAARDPFSRTYAPF
jgi:pilus assembly protein CpaD